MPTTIIPTSHCPTEKIITEITFHEILTDICRIFREDPELVRGPRRTQNLVRCRRLFCFVSNEIIPKSTCKIGLFLGNVDHTSSLFHIKKVKGFLKVKEPKFAIDWLIYTTDSKIWATYKQTNI